MKKERACIVPFSKKEIPILNYMPDKYEISSIISVGMELEGKEISFLTNRKKLGFTATVDWNKGVRECDIVIITDMGMTRERCLDTLIYEIIDQALCERKKVICFAELEEYRQQTYKTLAQKIGIPFTYVYEPYEVQAITRFEKISFKTPIVFLGEMTQECDGYEIVLKLVERLKKDGIRSAVISEDKYNALYEHQYFIQFYEKDGLEYNVERIKILVKGIEEEEKPDVIILKLPKPMTAFDNNVSYDYGISTFIISQAVHADYCIYCGLSEMFSEEFIFNINEHFKHKFGYPIDAFHISNQIVDIAYEPQEQVDTIYVPIGNVEEEARLLREQSGEPVYQLLGEQDFELFYQGLKKELFSFSYGRI